MSVPTSPASPTGPRIRWWILLMLFLSITINILDRQVLSMVAPVLREQYHLSESQYGVILFCFLLGMTTGQLPMGTMLDRIGARRAFPILVVGWSIVSMLHAFGRTVVQFSGLRFLLGITECGTFSGGVKVIGEWFVPKERGFATGLFNSGCLAGAVLAPPLIVWIINKYGWPAAFLIPGFVGCFWIIPWLRLYWKPADHPRLTTEERAQVVALQASSPLKGIQPRFGLLLGLAPVWGVILMRAFTGPVSHFYWYWLPEYLTHERHMSLTSVGAIAWLPFLFGGLGNIGGGWISSLLVRRGWDALRARKATVTGAMVLCLMAIFVPFAPTPAIAIALLCIGALGVNAMAANHMAVLTDLFPDNMLARVSGLTGVGDGLMSMFVMLFTGMIVQHFSYLPVFIAVGAMPLLALLSIVFLTSKAKLDRLSASFVIPADERGKSGDRVMLSH